MQSEQDGDFLNGQDMGKKLEGVLVALCAPEAHRPAHGSQFLMCSAICVSDGGY